MMAMKPDEDDDKDLTESERGLLISVAQMQRGEFAATHTPEQIMARRRGRPAGSTKANPKVSTSIRLSPCVLAAFRASGPGWQTRIDAALTDWLKTNSPASSAA
jgi:uncharacterized protein (DUF4415 family)